MNFQYLSFPSIFLLLCFTVSCTESVTHRDELLLSGKVPTKVKTDILPNCDVLIFRQQEGSFVYQSTFTYGLGEAETLWLSTGKYKFLFAYGYGKHTKITPELIAGATTFESVKFTSGAESSDRAGECDELYLQEGYSDTIYHIIEPTIVTARLKRAVTNIVLYIKRGYKDVGGNYIPLPYEKGQKILDGLDSMNLSITGCGMSLDSKGISSGKGSFKRSFSGLNCDSINDEGFAEFKGPYLFPAENDVPLNIELKLFTNNSEISSFFSFNEHIRRNQQLIITLWLTSKLQPLHILTDVRQIEAETEGEQGFWNDILTN